MRRKTESLPQGTLIPNHVAIIPDGNRRWARARGLPVFEGHRRGFDITPEIARACRNFGVHTVTIWAFSTENWDRSKEEIAFLMRKYEDFLNKHLKDARKENVRIIHLGRKDRIPPSLVKKLKQAEEETRNNTKYILNIALDYGGRDEILRATRKMLQEGINPEKLNEEVYIKYLDTGNQPYPYPDLIIRSSGEQRVSSFLTWQMGYSELYWLVNHFPETAVERVKEAILDYSRRRRRFGGNDLVPKVKFDPQKVAKLEVGWWKAHNQWKKVQSEENKEKIGRLLVEFIDELYGVGKKYAQKVVVFLIEGVKHHGTKGSREWEKAIKDCQKAYKVIKEKTNYVFSSQVAGQLEVSWWIAHDKAEKDLDKAGLEKAFRDYYGEIYRLSGLQATKVAHFKTLATFAHDLAEESKSEKEEKKYWHLAEKYLVETYRALREVAS